MKVQLAQPKTRRWLFATASTVALPAVLTACGAESGPASTGNSGAVTKPVTITYWGRWGGTSEQPEKQVIANFQEKFPNVTIQDMESNQIAGEGALDREKFIAALAAGTPPDVIKIDRFKMGGHGAKGTTTILDSVIKRDKIDMKKFFPATVEEVLYPPGSGGKVTAL
ncbi:MAG TPA: extracellular solute-binding protein, partial [Chloroflexota bacterium]|nr:extracellular solute-binding protein [Chloroflexota bacterium]